MLPVCIPLMSATDSGACVADAMVCPRSARWHCHRQQRVTGGNVWPWPTSLCGRWTPGQPAGVLPPGQAMAPASRRPGLRKPAVAPLSGRDAGQRHLANHAKHSRLRQPGRRTGALRSHVAVQNPWGPRIRRGLPATPAPRCRSGPRGIPPCAAVASTGWWTRRPADSGDDGDRVTLVPGVWGRAVRGQTHREAPRTAKCSATGGTGIGSRASHAGDLCHPS